MKGGVRFYLAGAVALLTLAGCGRSFLHFGEERAAWRHQAEVSCLKSGAVKIGAGVVQMQPIEGPGMCGADFPLKVAMLGESTALGYADEPRPPAGIPNASGAQPRWPLNEPRYAPAAPVRPVQVAPVQSEPIQGGTCAGCLDRRRSSGPRPPRRPAGRCQFMLRAWRSPTIFPTMPYCRPAASRLLIRATLRLTTRRSISRRRSAPCPRSGRCAARTRRRRSCRRR